MDLERRTRTIAHPEIGRAVSFDLVVKGIDADLNDPNIQLDPRIAQVIRDSAQVNLERNKATAKALITIEEMI